MLNRNKCPTQKESSSILVKMIPGSSELLHFTRNYLFLKAGYVVSYNFKPIKYPCNCSYTS